MRKGYVSERLVEETLRAIGFNILERNKEIEIDGKKVAEVDIVAEPPHKPYAIEVKAGKVDVSAVRQAYANAKLLGAVPMVIGTGWANEEAKLVADKLGVKYLMLNDLFICQKEELYNTTRSAIEDVISILIEKVEPDPQSCDALEHDKIPTEILKKYGVKGMRMTIAILKLSCILSKLLEKR